MNRCVHCLLWGVTGLLVWLGGAAFGADSPSGPAGAALQPAATTQPARAPASQPSLPFPRWRRHRRPPWWEGVLPPVVHRIAIPDFPGAHAIWGGTGSDSRGHVWFGVCADAPAPDRDASRLGPPVEVPSAHLFEYVPATGQLLDRGDVVSQLKRAGVWRAGEGQMKIHTKIIQAADGHLYFASMDEQNEDPASEKLPTWGSHLWRLKLPGNTWEHLLAVPEGLLAAAGGGRYFYALGYFGHVLYQYDTETGKVRSIKIGAIGGHISRNFFTDAREHVYVPRVGSAAGSGSAEATLVELDASLREVAETPLEHYVSGWPLHCHGIIGFQPLSSGAIAFLTHQGYLYLLEPPPAGEGPSKLKGLGWFHPRGSCYTASLLTDPANEYLMGVASRDGRYDWVIYSFKERDSYAFPFTIRGPRPLWDSRSLLYGSTVRDSAGNFYVAGRTSREIGRGYEPILLQIEPMKAAWQSPLDEE